MKINRRPIKAATDDYKVKQLRTMLEDIDYDNNPDWSHATLHTNRSNYINLDAGAIQLLIDYYSGKVGNYQPIESSVKKNKNRGKKPIKAATSSKLPYQIVSIPVILRDWTDIGDDSYVSEEHKDLVDIADSLYNADIDVSDMTAKYQELYKKYGKTFFNKVLKDVRALDSQVSNSNINDLIADYDDLYGEYSG